MKKLFTIYLILISLSSYAQEIGYVTGFTKQGINPAAIQPVYGITLQKTWKYISLESNAIYSQRMIGKKVQADYLDFMLFGKFGYFGNRAGAYIGHGIALNPTINHSGGENHTYLSHLLTAGSQVNILPKTVVEFKICYDMGITGAYYNSGHFTKYKGFMAIATLKFKINQK